MSIKLIDSLEPNGKFKLVNSEYVEYKSASWEGIESVSSALQKLEETVFATPQMYIARDNLIVNRDIIPESPQAITVPITLVTPSLGDCRITITRRLAGTTDPFSNAKIISKPAGPLDLELGYATTITDYEYRLVAIDGQNKSFKYYVYDSYDATTGQFVNAEEVEDIKFEVITGLLSFNSTFAEEAAKTIYEKDASNTIFYYVEHTYAKSCVDKLITYRVFEGDLTQADIATATPKKEQTVSLKEMLNCTGFAAASTTKYTDNQFVFTPTQTGAYTLEVSIDVQIGNSVEDLDSAASTKNYYTLDVMPPKTIFLTDLTSYLNQQHIFNSDHYINISLLPKTSSMYDKGSGAIELTGDLIITGVKDAQGNPQTTDISGNSLQFPQAYKSFAARVTDVVPYTWNLGRIYLDYLYEEHIISFELRLRAKGNFSETNEAVVISFSVQNKEPSSAKYNTTGLTTYFDFSDTQTFDTTNNTIKNKVVDVENDYRLQVVNSPVLSARQATSISSTHYDISEGVSREYVENIDCLNLSGISYAYSVVKDKDGNYVAQNPWLTYAEKNKVSHYTFETRLKGTCTGVLDAIALSLGYVTNEDSTKKCGIDITYDHVNVKQASEIQYDLIDNTWHHICITSCDTTKEEDIVTDSVTGYNSIHTLRIYVDGILCKICKISAIEPLGNIVSPLVLNGIANLTAQQEVVGFSNHGNVSVQFVRLYNRVLNSQEIFENYCSCLGDTSLTTYLTNKHNKSTAPVIYFVKNTPARIKANGKLESTASEKTLTEQMWVDKSLRNIDFANLHKIKVKKSDDSNVNTSKNSLVNCSIYWRDEEGTVVTTDTANNSVKYKVLPNVDVFLQGTSSLNYPVKNYQIKIYEDRVDSATPSNSKRAKTKVYPPYITPDIADEWLTDSYIYTLKCDYMEQSHRNNTPTACYYQDHVLPEVMNYCGQKLVGKHLLHAQDIRGNEITAYSPARSILDAQTNKPLYRDAISGIPCIVYYLDSPSSDFVYEGDNHSFNPESADFTYAGTYMFNVDKEGEQLGFEIETTQTTLVPGQEANASIYVNSSGRIIDDDGELLTAGESIDTYPCISYEGATNDNYSAAAFVPFSVQRNLLLQNIYDTAEEIEVEVDGLPVLHKVLYLRVFDTETNTYKLTEDKSEFIKDTVSPCYFTTFEDFKNAVLAKDNIVTPSNDENRHFYGVLSMSEHEEVYGADEYAYLKSTLEPRFTFAEDLEKTNKDEFNTKTYTVIKDAIDWVYNSVNAIETCTGSDEDRTTAITNFTTNFKNYFSFEYCLAYYLQLLTFTQVDNAGKNAMFDTWGDGRLYPRPYDMDTQMGLDNSGNDNMPVSAEVHYDLSPLSQTGAVINASNWPSISDPMHARFRAYNTNRSYLWKTFGTYFADQIKECYHWLREHGVYDADNIQKFVNGKTADIIGEMYYNDDAVLKYLKHTDTAGNPSDAYYYCVNGSRKDRYYNFIKQRLIFLDSVFDYNSETNGQVDIRADANTATSYIGLLPYSPIYSTIKVDSAATLTTLLEPTTRYLTNDMVTYDQGVKITVPTGGSNKNIYITGAGNLQTIRGLDVINTTVLQLEDAHKLSEIKLSGTSIHTLTFGSNEYLTHLDLSKMKNLAVSIDLSGCTNLQYLDIHESSITGIILPPRCDLTYLDCSDSNITSLELKNLANLETSNLKLTNCTKLTKLEIANCPNLKSLYTAEEAASHPNEYFPLKELTTLSKLSISGACNGFEVVELENLPLIEELNITNSACKTLICKDCSGPVFSNLGLGQLSNLTTLDLSGCKTLDNSKGSLVLSDTCQLETVYLHNTSFASVKSTADVEEDGTFNFSNLSSTENPISKISLHTNFYLKKLKGLKYVGSLQNKAPSDGGFLSKCSALETLENCSINSSNNTSCARMFYGCSNLRTIDASNTFTFKKINSANAIFRDCKKIQWSSVNYILTALAGTDSETLDLNLLLFGACCLDEYGTAITFELPAGNGGVLPSQTTSLVESFINSGVQTIAPGAFDNLTSLTSISHAFGSNLQYVPESLFINCSSLETADSAFARCSNLGTWTTIIINEENAIDITAEQLIEANIEATQNINTHLCNPVHKLSWTYNAATGKWKRDAVYYPPNIFSYDTKIFNAPSLTNIKGLFYGCNKLARSNAATATLNDFFEPLTSLTTCVGAFAGCTNLDFTFGTESIFEKCAATIEHVDALFFKSGLSSIPQNIFKRNSGTFSKLTTARGLFANCKNINTEILDTTNKIDEEFFKSATALQYIGNSASMDNVTYGIAYSYHINCQGMFANTSVYVDTKALYPLVNLKDLSGLFFAGKYTEVSAVSSSTVPITSDDEGTDFKYYPKLIDTNGNLAAQIQLFDQTREYLNLTNISYLFAGNPTIISVADTIFDKLSAVTSMQGTFTGCYNFNNGNIEQFFVNKTELTNTKWMFANCTALNYELDTVNDLFASCTKLSNCCGMFFNSHICGNVPASLFNSCRQSLTDTSYMFAQCRDLTHIDTGRALINNPTEYDNSDITYYIAEANIAENQITDFKQSLLIAETEEVKNRLANWFGENQQFDRYQNYIYEQYYKAVQDATNNTESTDDGKLYTRIWNKMIVDEADGSKSISVDELVDAGLEVPEDAALKANIYLCNPEGELSWTYNATNNMWEPDENYDVDRLIDINRQAVHTECKNAFDEAKTYYYKKNNEWKLVTFDSMLAFYYTNKKVKVLQPGLLSNCTKLVNVVYMFAGCTGLQGAIPADMFYFEDCLPNSGFKSLEGLFYGCNSLTCAKAVDFDALLDTDNTNPFIPYDAYSSTVSVTSTSTPTVQLVKTLPRGGNYSKVYPCALPAANAQSISIYASAADTETELPKYFVPQDWISSLTNLTNISKLFDNVGIARKADGSVISLAGNLDFTNVYEVLEVPMNLFDQQYLITNASYLFNRCLTIGDTVFTMDFLQNSLSNLSNVKSMLAHATVKGINNLFTKSGGGKNNALNNVYQAFYKASNNSASVIASGNKVAIFKVTKDGTANVTLASLKATANYSAPEFWNKQKFAKITSTTGTYERALALASGADGGWWSNSSNIQTNGSIFTGATSGNDIGSQSYIAALPNYIISL